MIIIAHNIRSLYNVGSIFRNAAAFNIEKLYLTGYTGAPPRKEIAKVALGAQDLVKWEKQEDVKTVLEKVKDQGYRIYGLDTGEEAVDISSVDRSEKIALVLGNEVEGIDSETISLLDGTVVVPMGKKRSLNVSVASGIAMFVLQ